MSDEKLSVTMRVEDRLELGQIVCAISHREGRLCQLYAGRCGELGPRGPLCFLVFVFSPPPSALEALGHPLTER